MDAADPLKATRRLQAQRNADKVRLQPYDYVDKSVAVINKRENFKLERNLDVMGRDGKITTDKIVREKKHFVEERRKQLRQVIPGLKPDFLQRSGKVSDSEMIKIVQYYEEKNPNVLKHTQNAVQRSFKKPGKLRPLNKPMSISLQDLSAIARVDASRPKPKGIRATSKLEILAENLPVARFGYSTRDGHSDMEKVSLRKRDTGIISCPAFYLETGGRVSNLGRETPMKAHSSLAVHGQMDENGLPAGAASLLLGYNSRAESRVTNRYETPTPVMKGPESKLSMHTDKLSREVSTGQIDGTTTGHILHPPSPLKHYIANSRAQINEGDLSTITSPSTDRSYSRKAYDSRKHLQSQSSDNSYDTLAGSVSSRSSIPTLTNTLEKDNAQASSAVEFPITKLHPAHIRAIPQTGKPYHSKPQQTEPSAGVSEILDRHLHPLQPTGKKVLPRIVATSSALNGEASETQAKVHQEEYHTKQKRRASPKKMYKNDKLISSFLVPSDVKKLCSAPFDPYILAVNDGEINELGTKQREKDTENRLKIQKEFFKTAQGNVQHWISDVDDQMKKDRLKYITNF